MQHILEKIKKSKWNQPLFPGKKIDKLLNWIFWMVLLAAIVVIILIIIFGIYSKIYNASQVIIQKERIVKIGNLKIPVEIADSSQEWQRGLSGRKFLDWNRGMLFVFPSPGYYGFWMPNMHFPIDIIWIDSKKRIVDISENILPESYPQKFYPKLPSQYVLEVNAGFVRSNKIGVGDLVLFENIELER